MSTVSKGAEQAPSLPLLPGKFRDWPTCQQCGRPVERVTITEVPRDNAVEVVAECHGEAEASKFSDFDYYRADTITLGTAFGGAATALAEGGVQ